MRKLKLYLETSVWNFLFADDAPDKMADTIRFFAQLAEEPHELFVSEMVFEEIEKAPDLIRRKLLVTIEEFEPVELEITDEVDKLARKYAEAGFLTAKAYEDLIHAAAASVNKMDFLVSWNLSHIVKAKTMVGINEINQSNGYNELKICTVREVLSDG